VLNMTSQLARPRDFRRAAILRLACGMIAVGSLGGMVFGGAFSSKADSPAGSSMAISWTGDSGPAAALQPVRDPHGFEFNEFNSLKVTVAQTQNLIDQAVRVDVSGFPGGTEQDTDGTGQIWTTATNFMQAMQCWGDPDSTTVDFRDTCEWGGRFAANNGLGFSIYSDNALRVASRDVSPTAANPVDVPFISRDGKSHSGRQVLDSTNEKNYPITEQFDVATSNELQGARIKSDGTGSFDFEMRTDIQSTPLGCGRGLSDLKCYLVLVPRGTKYGGHDASCSSIYTRAGEKYGYGQTEPIQAGSPLNPGCDYWNNRIVVPLQFNPVAPVCPSGAEQRVIGSQLVISAMASWQPALCTAAGSPYNFTSNPDSVARAELLEQKANVAFTSYPITRDELQDETDQAAYDHTAVSYAPVAIGAVAVSFIADGRNGRIDSLVLSPRLLAKLLTQSYIFEVPSDGTDPGTDDFAQLGLVNQKYTYLFQDPEFQRLNANWGDFITNPSLVLPGPSDTDAIAQVWKWVQSDTDARAFLNGTPDPDGMTVNPNYLPAGNLDAHIPVFDLASGKKLATPKAVGFSNLDGSPMSLATAPLNYFPKADPANVPHTLGIETSQYNSLQSSPYVDDFVKSAQVAFRANPGAKTGWDPTAYNTNNTFGDWVSGGPQVPGQRFVISVTDAASTARYNLTPVGLRAANGTVVTTPGSTSMAAAVASGLSVTRIPAVKQIDPSKVSSDGYPLTTVVYAAVNLSASTTLERASVSKMITYIAGDGQSVGTQVGQLPLGYLPLSGDLQSQANVAALAIASYIAPQSASVRDDSGSSSATSYGTVSDGSAVQDSPAGRANPTSPPSSQGPIISAVNPAAMGLTLSAQTTPLGQSCLAIALLVGLLGAIFAPVVIRGLGRR
jgi:hypothetical protein